MPEISFSLNLTIVSFNHLDVHRQPLPLILARQANTQLTIHHSPIHKFLPLPQLIGFILGAAIALRLNKGFIPIPKGGKLPGAVTMAEFVDYSGQKKAPELRQGSFSPGDQILLVDEWIETGAQAQAAINLIENQGGQIAGLAAINIDTNPYPRAYYRNTTTPLSGSICSPRKR
jgi:orotate phosphoribosyltransferase